VAPASATPLHLLQLLLRPLLQPQPLQQAQQLPQPPLLPLPPLQQLQLMMWALGQLQCCVPCCPLLLLQLQFHLPAAAALLDLPPQPPCWRQLLQQTLQGQQPPLLLLQQPLQQPRALQQP
jgi:hypothetical protein